GSLRDPDNLPGLILDRRNGQGDVHYLSAFPSPHSLKVLDLPLPTAQPVNDDGLFVNVGWGYQQRDRLPQGLLRGVSKEALGPSVPTDDGALERFPDAGIARAIDNGGQIGVRRLSALLVTHAGGQGQAHH